ncbi:hypothetical protein SK128_016238 [Halocaridina rubra]|uniref:Dimethyladenosine transferase 2, mitochondrial n=1 Tax=Halocaridina rubra TaxID=373956 RepID=A0AAN8XSR6_HALRR
MAIQKLMSNAWAFSPRLNATQHGCVRMFSFLSGSRYVSSPSDDQENSSVICDLLVHERRKQTKKSSSKVLTPSPKPINTIEQSKNSPSDKKSRKINGNNIKTLNDFNIMSLMRAIKSKSTCYIVNENAANTLVRHLKKDLQPGDIIAEGNLGAGVLTKALLNFTNHRIIGYEPNTEFMMYLKSQFTAHASRLELHCLDIFKFYWYYTLNKREPEREGEADKLAQLLKPLPERNSEAASQVKIVSSVCDIAFFHRLALSFTFQCCFFKDVFPVFYLYIPKKIYEYFKKDSKHVVCRRLRLPFLYYFTVEHLDTAPRSHFYSSKVKRKKKNESDEECFHLVKISPKVDVSETIPLEQLEMFHYFMRCMNKTRASESLIFQMEKWIPGCGIDYIKNGFRMFVNPRQHTEDQLLEAYRLFISLPSFKECMFHHHCENWSIQFGLKDEESSQVEETTNENTDEKVNFDIDEDDEAFSDIKGKRYWRDKSGI